MKIHSRKKTVEEPPKAKWPFPAPSTGPAYPPPPDLCDDEEVLRRTVEGVDINYAEFDDEFGG